MADAYQYAPLPEPTSIRVLQLIRSNESENLQCSLAIINLAEAPKYSCISYTWGNPHATGAFFTDYYTSVAPDYHADTLFPMLCDGKFLYIRRNLHDALRRLPLNIADRRVKGDVENRALSDATWFWVDAICIDQKNVPERNAQVGIMGTIFAQAELTIFWLGEADDKSELGCRTLRKLAAAPGSIADSEVIPYLKDQSEDVFEKAQIPVIKFDEWTGLASLFLRQWHFRLWICQEVILSNRISIFVGKEELDWKMLLKVATDLLTKSEQLGYSASSIFIPPDGINAEIERSVVTLARWRDRRLDHTERGHESSAHYASLLSLIRDTWTFQVTDPRDKIYGLLGLYSIYWPDKSRTLANYSVPVEQCFADVTKRIIDEEHDLQIFITVQDASISRHAGLPSWVPDFSFPYINMLCGIFNAGGRTASCPAYAASSWDEIILHGYTIDIITQSATDRRSKPNNMLYLNHSWFELAAALQDPYCTGQSRTEVLWRTLAGDQNTAGSSSPAPDEFGALFKDLICYLLCREADEEAAQSDTESANQVLGLSLAWAAQTRNSSPFDGLTAEDITAEIGSVDGALRKPHFKLLRHSLFILHLLHELDPESFTPSLAEVERYAVNAGDFTQGDLSFVQAYFRRNGKRRLFVTEKGYMGLGPLSLRTQDRLCVVPGFHGIMVLRQRGEEDLQGDKRVIWNFVGEAFVAGLMDGEGKPAAETPMEIFILK